MNAILPQRKSATKSAGLSLVGQLGWPLTSSFGPSSKSGYCPEIPPSTTSLERMPNQLDHQWWQRACDESPEAIAFVDTEDMFLYVNHAWSLLTGYSAAQLVGKKRWLDITADEDIGGDIAAADEIREGKSDSYYTEKKYRRADHTFVHVGIYVHRHPPFGPHEGFMVFAKRVGSQEMATLQQSYSELKSTVTLLQEMTRGFKVIDAKCEAQSEAIDDIQRTLQALIGAKGSVTIGGDYSGQDKIGRDKNSILVLVFIALCVLGLGVLTFGGKLLLEQQRIILESDPLKNPTESTTP